MRQAERAVLDMERTNDYSRLEKARYEDIKRIIVEHVTGASPGIP